MPDDLTPDAFARLTALEQSQELLRRAQFLDASSRGRHATAMDRHEGMLAQHQAMLARHTQTMADLATLQATLDARPDALAVHQQEHAQHMARLDALVAHAQQTLDAVLEMLRHRNGH